MSLFQRVAVGFILTPGFRAADLVQLQAILGAIPGGKKYYAAETPGPVPADYGLRVQPNTTFAACPDLDVLVVGETSDSLLGDERYLEFVKSKSQSARYVIGVANGVMALAKTGLLAGRQATSDSANTDKLAAWGAIPVHERKTVTDGKYHTSGPSTGGMESAFMVLQKLAGKTLARLVELSLEYDPRAQFPGAGPDKSALESTRPLKVAVMVTPGTFVPDIIGAVDVLGAIPGTEFIYTWKEKTRVKALGGLTLHVGTTFEDCPAVDVVIVGAVPARLGADTAVTDFIIRQEQQAKAIICTCAGALLVGAAGLLAGRRATSNFQMKHLLARVGATPGENPMEVDGKIYSAGPAVGSYEVALVLVRDLFGEAPAACIEQRVLEYAPNPVFGVGSPERAGPLLKVMAKALLAPFLPAYGKYMTLGYRRNGPGGPPA